MEPHRRPIRMALGALLLLQEIHSTSAKVVGVTVDIEATEARTPPDPLTHRTSPNGPDPVLFWDNMEVLRNATAAAHALGLRFSADTRTYWPNFPVTNPVDQSKHPAHEIVMEIVDEVVLMDYFGGCRGPQSVAGATCNPMTALFYAAPFLSYSNLLYRRCNRTALVTVGVAVEEHAGKTPDRFRSSNELETFLNQSAKMIEGFTQSSASPQGFAAFHRFAVFQDHAYMNMTDRTPCTVHACAARVPRALWSYSSDVFDNVTYAHTFVGWCVEQAIDEVYLLHSCPARMDAATKGGLLRFVSIADASGVDVQLYAGESNQDVGPCMEAIAELLRTE